MILDMPKSNKNYTDRRENYLCGACHGEATRVVRVYTDGSRAIEKEIPHKGLDRKVCDGIPKLSISVRGMNEPVKAREEPARESDFSHDIW